MSRDHFRIATEKEHTFAQSIEDETVLFLENHSSIEKTDIDAGEKVRIFLVSSVPLSRFKKPRAKTIIKRNDSLFNNSSKEGFLTKRGNSFQSWKRRWCILQDNFIFYFRTKMETQPLGAVPIQDCLFCGLAPYPGRNFCFTVHTRSRIFYMTGRSLRESSEWVTAINRCMADLGIEPIDPEVSIQSLDDKTKSPNHSQDKVDNIQSLESKKSGYLYKTGKDIKSGWKKRYFHMKDNCIYYFKTKKSTSPVGYIPLQDAFIAIADEPVRKHLFHIHTQHRVYNLAAEDNSTMEDWVAIIQETIMGSDDDSLEWASLHLDQFYWDSLDVSEFNIPSNVDSFLDEVLQSEEWLLNRNKEQFGPIPDDPEKDTFFVLTYSYLQDKHRHQKRKEFTPAEVTHYPLPKCFPKSFPVYFKLIKVDGETNRCATKSILCPANSSVRDAIQSVIGKSSKFRPPTPKRDDSPPNSREKRAGSNFGRGRLFSFGDESSADHYVVRVSGLFEYIVDASVCFSSIRYVQECLKRNKKIQFTLEERNMRQAPEMYAIGSQRSSTVVMYDTIPCYPSRTMARPFVMKILVVEHTEQFTFTLALLKTESFRTVFFIDAYISYGNEMIGTMMRTMKQKNMLFADILSNNLLLSNLPREAKLNCTLYARSENGDLELASVKFPLFDCFGRLVTGPKRLPMDVKIKHKNLVEYETPELVMEFISSPLDIVHLPSAQKKIPDSLPPTPEEAGQLERILYNHPLHWLKANEKELIWKHRKFISSNYSSQLPILLNAVDWLSSSAVQEAHQLLTEWPLIEPLDALRLLDSSYADVRVRKFALRCIDVLSDTEFPLFLLQMVQALKYETYHFSELSLFLLTRSLCDPDIIGHELFWFLKAELDINPKNIRFRYILEQFMLFHGPKSHSLFRQCDLVSSLSKVAQLVKETKVPRRDEVLREALLDLYFPVGSILPINPSIHIRGLIVEKCKWLDSFTVPLWLAFKNYDDDEDPIYVIYKVGDDLRQDALTVQMIRVMDNFWRQEGIDMHLTPYRVIATGKDCGMIEVVLNAETTANIQKMAGGASAVFSLKPLTNWLFQNNPVEVEQKKAIDNFMFSMAGYCVATYVLGIGDRHNDNIMVTKEGHLFHIDFAHFLGNVMKFYGIKRERAPFVLTPDFVNVIGGKDSPGWHQFVELCCQSFNRIRARAPTFITLFMLMISSGMPQLTSQEDLHYLLDSFCVGKSDKEAEKIFTSLIIESLNTKATQLNFAIHILAHRD